MSHLTTRWIAGCGALLFGLGAWGVSTAQAKTSAARVVTTTKVAAKTYHVTKKGNVYTSTKLTKVRTQARVHANVTVTKQAKLRQNGKQVNYRYITTKKYRGWLKSNHLKAGRYQIKSDKFNVKAANKAFLATVNQYRHKHNTAPIKQAKAYQTLAMQRARELYTIGFTQYTKQDKPYAQLDAKKLGIQFRPTTCATCLYGGGPISESIAETSGYNGQKAKSAAKIGKAQAKDLLYHSVQGSWDNRENLVRSNSTKIGIGWFYHQGDIYLAVNAQVTHPANSAYYA